MFLNELIGEFPEIICDSTGLAQVTPYEILLKDVKPAVRCLFPCTHGQQRVLRPVIDGLLQKCDISKSTCQINSLKRTQLVLDTKIRAQKLSKVSLQSDERIRNKESRQ